MSKILREPECFATSQLSNMTRRRLEEKGLFPKRFKLNPESGPFGAVGWDEDEVLAWKKMRMESRGDEREVLARKKKQMEWKKKRMVSRGPDRAA